MRIPIENDFEYILPSGAEIDVHIEGHIVLDYPEFGANSFETFHMSVWDNNEDITSILDQLTLEKIESYIVAEILDHYASSENQFYE